ncbi:hypothetical protein [Streptomyces sp. bgisy022]|uniref:hypothetical protein n=1 Tax=Streptomyces sp. bgisy022 TaxID=3413769 RepID=UPI003D70E40E
MRIAVTGETEPDAIDVTGGQPATIIEVDTSINLDGGPSGGVASVNGVTPDETGNVELGAGDVGADPAGTAAAAVSALGLGTAATRNIGTTAGTVAAGDDSRFTNARTPTVHAATHATAGSDPITAAAIGAYPAASGAALESGKLDKVGGTITGSLTVNTVLAADAMVALHVDAETFDRVRVLSDRIEMGPGTGARDTNLRRSGANEWTTDDALIVTLMLRHMGTTLGFYGATAVAKPTVTGSRGGNAALASLLTALANLGLITNNSTA